MTIAQILKFATNKLGQKNIKLPTLEAEILLSEILKKPREFLLIHGEKKLTTGQILKLKSLIAKRLLGQPIAYLTGHKEFYGLNFLVNKNTLIPRPETELMVEEALRLATRGSQPITLIDVGTGSGCIIITLAKLLKQKSKIINYELWGTDISLKALLAAKQNAKLNGVEKNIKFLRGSLLEPFKKLPNYHLRGNGKKKKLSQSKFVILANLPYLTPKQIKNSSSIKHEPKIALLGGKNGLELYKKLFQQINHLIHDTKYIIHNTLSILCEIGPGQTAELKQLIKGGLPQANCQIKKDLAGLNRLAIVEII